MANLKCLVPITTLQAPPYSLAFDDPIYFRLSASNIFGTSEVSVQGNGGYMVVQPESPINLTKDTV